MNTEFPNRAGFFWLYQRDRLEPINDEWIIVDLRLHRANSDWTIRVFGSSEVLTAPRRGIWGPEIEVPGEPA